jgi:hypothetical protein
MLKLTTLRGVIVAVAALALVAGCTASGKGTAKPVGDLFAPTGAPVTLTQIQGAKGDKLPLGDGLSIVMPEGSVSKPMKSKVEGNQFILYLMPDANTEGFPQFQLIWGKSSVGALEASWTDEGTMGVNKSVSNYVRSSATWPGAKAAVVATWTQEDARDSGLVVVDALGLWVDMPDGSKGFALAMAPKGQLDGSTALDALRSLTVG